MVWSAAHWVLMQLLLGTTPFVRYSSCWGLLGKFAVFHLNSYYCIPVQQRLCATYMKWGIHSVWICLKGADHSFRRFNGCMQHNWESEKHKGNWKCLNFTSVATHLVRQINSSWNNTTWCLYSTSHPYLLICRSHRYFPVHLVQ